ncbi:hypothetical protein [Prosthecomicrobium sp. N25]|uniref:hypothetical protein n=1 Tax=Prosthecomicrobium sp. N25 TaxID=3129254 RepID=UPI0030780361
MALTGISKYRPQFYTPKYASLLNRQAGRDAADAIAVAANTFASQFTDNGSSMVNLTIKKAVARVQEQAKAKLAKSMSGVNKIA